MSPSRAWFGVRLALWPTVIALPAVVVLLTLGTWQIDRATWKRTLIAERAAALAGPVAPLPLDREALDNLGFRRVSVSGEFLHDKELYLANRQLYLAVQLQMSRAGYHVLTPFRLADGDGLVLVNRGWIPLARKDPSSRLAGQIFGPTTVQGFALRPATPSIFLPDNDAATATWHSVDLAAMGQALGLELLPILIEAGEAANPGGMPLGAQTRVDLPNNHLPYAIVWYALAVALAAIYLLYHRRCPAPERPDRPV